MSETFSSEFKAAVAFYAFTAWEFIVKWAKWYWKRYARETLCFLCGFLLAIIVLRSGQTKQIAAMEQRLIEAQQTAETEKEPTPGQLWSQQNQLTENLARVLQGVDRYDLSKAQKLAYLQVLNNRANPNIQYDIMKGTDDLDSVLQVPQQFEGFRYGEGYYTKSNFEIAEEFLAGDMNYLNSDRYFWARISDGTFVAMDAYDGSGSNQKVN